MATNFPPLLDILAQVPDPRHRQGRRYELRSILALLCAATLCGYRSYGAMAEWGQNYGVEFLRSLGFTQDRCPCKSTLCERLRRLDVRALSRSSEVVPRFGIWYRGSEEDSRWVIFR